MANYTGKQIYYFEELPSTNSYATELLLEQPPEGSLIQAGYQSAGRGQKGSRWESQAHENLIFSVIYYPTFLPINRVFQLSKMTAVALYDCLRHFLPKEEILIKWPNDLLVNKKKIAGILLENQFEGKHLRSSVIGIGLNVNQADFPEELTTKATSLALLQGKKIDIGDVLQRMMDSLEARYEELKQAKASSLDRFYLQQLYGYQEEVEVEIEGEGMTVMPVGVGLDGRVALVIDGVLKYFDIKEVKWMIPN
ncbi:MAG: biotin--[acetyl-CoA-carboxylase] ligase [Bacteroidota bacterium]